MPKPKRQMIDIETIALRTTLSRELCQFQEKVTQMRRGAASQPDGPNKDAITQDADNLVRHIGVLNAALADLD